MEYICECGKIFEKPSSYNGHKSHCKLHFEALGKVNIRELNKEITAKKISETFKKKRIDKQAAKIDLWIEEKHICEHCGIVMNKKYGSGRFCSRYCANSRKHSDATRAKIGNTVSATACSQYRKAEHEAKYLENPSRCIICSAELEYSRRRRKSCTNLQCISQVRTLNGLKSAAAQSESRRSKNEIFFCTLCENYFKQVDHNKPIFNGWDADIIIHDHKIAILWNGIWHHKKITKQHSVKQVQARDTLKIKNIKNCGYTCYIIDDFGIFNPEFVQQEFEKFISYLKSESIKFD